MLLRIAGKLAWGTTKFTVKHIVVPIAITAATAVVLDEISTRLRGDEKTKQTELPHNGLDPMITPEP